MNDGSGADRAATADATVPVCAAPAHALLPPPRGLEPPEKLRAQKTAR
jgi:hypothetical protein